MKSINWNTKKSVALKPIRGICFENEQELFLKTIIPSRKAYRIRLMYQVFFTSSSMGHWLKERQNKAQQMLAPARLGASIQWDGNML